MSSPKPTDTLSKPPHCPSDRGLLWFIGWLSCAPRFYKIFAAASVFVKFIEQKNFNS